MLADEQLPGDAVHKLSELYMHWWAKPETQQLKDGLLDRIRRQELQPKDDGPHAVVGRPGSMLQDGPAGLKGSASPPSSPGTPPRSPRRTGVAGASPPKSPRSSPVNAFVSPPRRSPDGASNGSSPMATGAVGSPPATSPLASPLAGARSAVWGPRMSDVDSPDTTPLATSPCATSPLATSPLATSPMSVDQDGPRSYGQASAAPSASLPKQQQSPHKRSIDLYASCHADDDADVAPQDAAGAPPSSPPKRVAIAPPLKLPRLRPSDEEVAAIRGREVQQMGELLRSHGMGATSALTPEVVAEMLPLLPGGGVPTYLSHAVWPQLQLTEAIIADGEDGAGGDAVVTAGALHAFFASRLAGLATPAARLRVCLVGTRAHVTRGDLVPLLADVVKRHPSLQFLAQQNGVPSFFVERYAETAILRIFYAIDPLRLQSVPAARLERCGLLEALEALDFDASEEINDERHFFSYEHFYVIYSKFSELDSHHESELSLQDLLRYANYSLSVRAVQRIFAMRTEPTPRGGLGYSDFVWFLLAEEDKTTPTACSYWFQVLDLDGDGVVSMFEMEHFYSEQLARLREVEQEAVGTRDVLCQLLDAINPSRRDGAAAATSFTLPDLRRCQQCGLVANTLCNLHKFLAIESHDSQAERDKHAMPHLTEWDRWAKAEYARLAEDEGEDQASFDELEGLEEIDEREFRMWSGRNMGSSGALESPF
tara:strand:- start:202 stop:2337 length:2136 start_codon:yes stop_codon:yes gene_type:complete